MESAAPDAAVGAAHVSEGAHGQPESVNRRSWLLVICSLEPWGEVRRRLQLIPEELLNIDPDVRILYVEPALDIPHTLVRRKLAPLMRRTPSSPDRVTVVQPRKWLPRVLGPFTDRSLIRQVRRHVRRQRRRRGGGTPVLWVNDCSYAGLVTSTGWPSVYDVTDDWLASSMTERARRRLRRADQQLVEHCGAVVVCSPDLSRSRERDDRLSSSPTVSTWSCSVRPSPDRPICHLHRCSSTPAASTTTGSTLTCACRWPSPSRRQPWCWWDRTR